MFGLIAKKDKAMEIGYNSYNILKDFVYQKLNKDEKSPSGDECKPCKTPKEMLDLLYNSSEYRNFVVDSLVVKKICQKISLIKMSIIITVLLAILAIFMLVGVNVIGIILTIILVVFAILFFIMFKSGKNYEEYYEETMSKILLMSVSEYSISKNNNKVISKDYIDRFLDIKYDKYITNYNCRFESEYETGDEFKLQLKDIVIDENKNTRTEEVIFDGFSIISKNKNPHNILNGSVIKIREDNNIISSLIEDTVNSIAKSNKDFSFNSEKLNKHLDCRLSRTGISSDIDQKMFEVTKIITPAFEERMLFLDERYNAFNMNISDDEFSFTVNMKKDAYQKFTSGELFKFGSNYKDKNFNTNVFLDSNFRYDRLYPILERLFLRKYFRIIYNCQMDGTRFNSYENEKVNIYENEIKDIMNMPWSEFSKMNEDYVKNLKEVIDEKYNNMNKEETNKEDDRAYLEQIENEKNISE